MKYFLAVVVTLIILTCLLLYYHRKTQQKNPEIPKIIWSFWDSEDIPEFIQKCKKTWADKNPTYKINMLSMKTLKDFTTHEEFEKITNWKYNNCTQKMSDLVRLTILPKYGGIWLDASIVCYESFDWVHEPEKSDKCILYSIPELSTSPLLESWFIACAPNNQYVKEWRDEFFGVAEFDSIDEYVDKSKVDLTGISYTDYLLVYICARKVYMKDTSRVEVMNATQGPYVYHIKGGIKNICNVEKPKFFKFRKEDRATIESEGEHVLKCIFD